MTANTKMLWRPVFAALMGLMWGEISSAWAVVVSDAAASVLIAHSSFSGFGDAGSPRPGKVNMNDGNLTAVDTFINFGFSSGLGYDFGGFTTIDSLRLVQNAAFGDGSGRDRVKDVRVFYTGGSVDISDLSNANDVTIALPSPVDTSFVFMKVLSHHDNPGFADSAVTEFTANSTTGVVVPANYLAGMSTANISLVGWADNIFSSSGRQLLVDSNLQTDESTDSMNVWLNFFPDGTGTDNSITFDLGTTLLAGTVGFDQSVGNASTGTQRNTLLNVRLQFDDASDFSTPLATYDFSVPGGLGYTQLDFPQVAAQYFRFSALQSETDGTFVTIGLREVQLFAAVPEPSAAALALIGFLAFGRTRRRYP